jgi:histidine kinase
MRRVRGLGARLFLSHFLVVLVGMFTLLVAVLVIAPLIFGNLMSGMMEQTNGMGQDQMMGGMGQMMDSATRAFGRTILYSLLIAGLAATVAAAATSLFVSRRITHPVVRMLAATRRIAAGRYDERVPIQQDDELGALSGSFNAMAEALEANERRRTDAISDVSHELRTPLSNLQGYLEGLAEGVVEPSEETWTLLRAETERMRRLVDDMRQLSRAEAGRLDLDVSAVSAREIFRIAAERMLPLFEEKGVELKIAAAGEDAPILADRDRVVQILTNLLDNALRHTPAGGKVVVEAERRAKDVLFRVEDTGEGVDAEYLPRLFERFYRVERSRSRGEARGGSGVGLAICRALVEAMGGSIWAESAGAGRGATFFFTLPRGS